MPSFDHLEGRIRSAMRGDRYRFQRQLRTLREADRSHKPLGDRLAKLEQEVHRSIALRESRRRGVPAIHFDAELPVSARREEIARAIQEHQVVIVSGETGSGKSTQLPKICLDMGRGVQGFIGHTQPRRIAARSVAARIAEELGSPLGRHVGFKVRFAESISPQTYIKLMTDGILLAETQNDPYLEQYDTIILDEAHERSLNIDFLIGYLKRLLPKRRDLKLIITSATIDAARFASHFATPDGPAPWVEVSGRTYPVEVRWRPMAPNDEGDEPDLQDAVLAAVEEVSHIDRGDMLIFMPTERHIHETAKALRDALAGQVGELPRSSGLSRKTDTEVLPLYARLSLAEQQKVFQPGPKRRIVIATNVAESSLTVPRIRYVIDPGTARISRYSPRSKTQRLPIEAVSQASADQRKGRCGRLGPGVCVRLFSEEDYVARDHYTVPEIQRTNLAAVILQTKSLRLGPIERFPFLDPPKPDAIRDGYRTLFEIGALDQHQDLTEVGRQLSRLPVDPRIGRMILAASEAGCLHEVLIIASALEVQDPRERPLDKQDAADSCHAPFADEQSDFISYLKLWDFYHKLRRELSRNQLRKACRQNFLSWNRMREWLDVHRELQEVVKDAGLSGGRAAGQVSNLPTGPHARTPASEPPARSAHRVHLGGTDRDQYAAVHRAILTGLLSSLALRGDGYEYSVAGGGKAHLWPGSGVFQGKPKWVVAAEVVETTKRYLRTCARIDPIWIEPIAGHLIKRSYREVFWDPAQASAIALERVTLFGLTIVGGRRVRYGPIDPETSRHLLIEHGLVEGHIEPKPEFLLRNQEKIAELQRLEAKIRRRDLIVGDWVRYQFYDRRIPACVVDGASLAQWLREDSANGHSLLMVEDDLLREAVEVDRGAFPDRLAVRRMELPLEYRYDPGSAQDGVTVTVPLEGLNQLDPEPLEWLVRGRLEEKVLALIRSLPKTIRTRFVPAPEAAKKAVPLVRFGEGDLRAAVAAALSRIGGIDVPPDAFQNDRLPDELRMNIRVADDKGRTVSWGRDLEALRQKLGNKAAASFNSANDPRWNRDGLTAWDLDELPAEIDVDRAGVTMKAHPTMFDRKTSVSLRLVDSPQRAAYETHFGLRRLFLLATQRELETQVEWLPGLDQIESYAAALDARDLRQELVELLAGRAFLADGAVPRAKPEFERQLAAGRERIGVAVQEVMDLVRPLFEGCHQTLAALEQNVAQASSMGTTRLMNTPLTPAGKMPVRTKWQYAVDDIREQISHLMRPGFLASTPWDWLRHYPRYFRAVRFRLESLPGSLPRDRQKLDEFQPRWQLYLEHARRQEQQGIFDPELLHYRWMLEEYRVSLFAQKIGTAIPVSFKRLEQQWAKVRV